MDETCCDKNSDALSDEDVKSDVSAVTSTTINTPDARSPALFPSFQKYHKKKENQLSVVHVTEGPCSPIIPVLSVSFLSKSIKRASQSSVEDDSDSNESCISESLLSVQVLSQKNSSNVIKECKNETGDIIHEESKQYLPKKFVSREIIHKDVEICKEREITEDCHDDLRDDSATCSSPKKIKLNLSNDFSCDKRFGSTSVTSNSSRIAQEFGTDSQETYLPDMESQVENTRNFTSRINKIPVNGVKENILPNKLDLHSIVPSYEMVALTNTIINNEKLQMLDENYVAKMEYLETKTVCQATNSSQKSSEMSQEENGCMQLVKNKETSQDDNEQFSKGVSLTSNNLQIACMKDLPHLSEQDIDCVCNSSPNVETGMSHNVGKASLSVSDKTKAAASIPQETVFVTSLNNKEASSYLSKHMVFEGNVLDTGGIIMSSQVTVSNMADHLTQLQFSEQPISSFKNCRKTTEVLDGSQILFADTQSSLSSVDKSSDISLSSKNLKTKIPHSTQSDAFLDEANGQHFTKSATATILQSSTAAEKSLVTEHIRTGYKTNEGDMDISSDVEPSQMILLSCQKANESIHMGEKMTSVTSSQSSSLSSLGDLSEGDVNYKTKEQQILCKVEKMQRKIHKKLTTCSKKTSVLDIEVTKQQLQAIKGILVQIAERHKTERNRLSVEVKTCKSKTEKAQIRECLIELSERQKALYKLFQKHKEISGIIRNDIKLNELFAAVLTKGGAGQKSSTGTPRSNSAVVSKGKVNGKENTSSKNGKSEEKSCKTPKQSIASSVSNKSQQKRQNIFQAERNKQDKYTPVTKYMSETMDFTPVGERIADTDYTSNEEVDGSPENHTNFKIIANNSKGETTDNKNGHNFTVSLNGTKELYYDPEEKVESQGETIDSNHGITITLTGDATATESTSFVRSNVQNEERILKTMGLFTSTVSNVKKQGNSFGHGPFAEGSREKPETQHTLNGIDNEKPKIQESLSFQRKRRNNSDEEDLQDKSSNSNNSKEKSQLKFNPEVPSRPANKLSQQMESSSESQTKNDMVTSGDACPVQFSGVPLLSAQKVDVKVAKRLHPQPVVYDDVATVTRKTNSTYLSIPVKTTKVVNSTINSSCSPLTDLKNYTAANISGVCYGKEIPKVSENLQNGMTQSSKQKPVGILRSQHHSSTVTSKSNSKKSQKNLSSESGQTQHDKHSRDEMMKKVIEDAMRIVSDKHVGFTSKQPMFGMQSSSVSKQSTLYTAEPLKPINTDIFKSPPIRLLAGVGDVSPSVASFRTFKSTFPEHSPDIYPKSQYLTEDIGVKPTDRFNGLKYPSLDMLIEQQIIKPGRNLLAIIAREKEFKASLTEDGYIESIGGELFQTPVKWLAAVLGKPVADVKKNRAYREVHYRGRPLMAYLEDPTLMPINGDDSQDSQGNVQSHVSQSSQHSLQKLTDLLNVCTIRLLEERDLVSDNDLPENFWTDDFSAVKLNLDMWKNIDKWD